MNSLKAFRVAVCAAIVAITVAGAGFSPLKSLAGQDTSHVNSQGAAALDRSRNDSQYDAVRCRGSDPDNLNDESCDLFSGSFCILHLRFFISHLVFVI